MTDTDNTQQQRNNTNDQQDQNQQPNNDEAAWRADSSKYDWGFFKGSEEPRKTPHNHSH